MGGLEKREAVCLIVVVSFFLVLPRLGDSVGFDFGVGTCFGRSDPMEQ